MRPSAYRTWLALSWVTALINTTVFTTAAVYFVREVGANPLQLILIGTVMEFAVFVFELPTGAFADSHGRRASVIVSYLVEGIAFLIVGASTSYAAVLIAYVIWGIGATFGSGALEAWITDEMQGRDLEKVFLRGGQFFAAGQLVGFAVAAVAANVDLRLPFTSGGLLSILVAVALAVAMREDHWIPRARTGAQPGPFRRLGTTALEGVRIVRLSSVLLAVLVFVALLGMYTESYDRLWEAHLLAAVDFPALAELRPVVWFAIIGVIELLLGIVVMGRLASRFTYTGPERSLRSLRLLVAIQCVGLLAFALSRNFYVAVAASFAVNIARGIGASLFSAWLNRQIESSHRATVLSIVNQSDAVGQWAGGPLIGAVGTVFSLRWALSLGAAILVPALAILERVRDRFGGSLPLGGPAQDAASALGAERPGEAEAGGP